MFVDILLIHLILSSLSIGKYKYGFTNSDMKYLRLDTSRYPKIFSFLRVSESVSQSLI